MEHVIQIGGAVLVLLGYALGQLGRLDTSSRAYLTLNLLGSVLLAFDAFAGKQWGFLILNGVWATIALANLTRSAWSSGAEQSDTSA